MLAVKFSFFDLYTISFIYMKNKTTSIIVLILICGSALFFPNIGKVHLFDWDEINFAEGAREMIVLGDYTRVHINFQPFWEKPPLFMWFQAASMHIFGVNEFAARFPNAVCGLATLILIFLIGKKYYDEKMGVLWVLIYAGSLLPQLYFMSGIIDPWFNLFIFLGIYFLSEFSSSGRFNSQPSSNLTTRYILYSGILIGLAVLTKGPAAGLITVLCVVSYWIIKRKTFSIKPMEIIVFFLAAGVVTFAWFGIETIKNGFWFLQEFIVYQIRLLQTEDAGHGGPFYYHFVVILLGVFPASWLAVRGMKRNFNDSDRQTNFKLWMIILLWVVVILFSLVKTKIIHYSSLAYFPVTFLAAYYLHSILTGKAVWKKTDSVVMVVLGFFITAFFIAFPILFMNKSSWIDQVKDKFAVELIKAPVFWSGFETIFILLFLLGLIAGLLLIHKEQIYKGVIIMFIFSAVGINLTLHNLLPNIDQHLQKSMIGIYSDLAKEDCYVDVLGFKSYAHLFYTGKKNPENKNSLDRNWLLTGDVDKPVYFICKSTHAETALRENPQLIEVKRDMGYVLLKRIQ